MTDLAQQIIDELKTCRIVSREGWRLDTIITNLEKELLRGETLHEETDMHSGTTEKRKIDMVKSTKHPNGKSRFYSNWFIW